jgi:hypothetical protein
VERASITTCPAATAAAELRAGSRPSVTVGIATS